MRAGRPSKRARSLTLALVAVHPVRVGCRPGNAIAFAEPAQEVAVLAAAASRTAHARRSAACRRSGSACALGCFGIGRRTWEARRRPASRPLPPTCRESASSQSGCASSTRDDCRVGDEPRWRQLARARHGGAGRGLRTRRGPARARTATRVRARADDLKEAEAVDRGALERLRQDRVDRRRRSACRCRLSARRSASRCRSSRRCRDARIARARRRPRRPWPARAAASVPSTSISVIAGVTEMRSSPPANRTMPAARLLEQVGPARVAESVVRRRETSATSASSGGVVDEALVGHAARAAASTARPRECASRVDFDAERGAFGNARERRPAADTRPPSRLATALERASRASRRFDDRARRLMAPSSMIRASTISPSSIRTARVSPIPRSMSHSGNRISRRLQQQPRLGKRKSDDVRIAAGDVANVDFAIALERIAAGLAVPLAMAGVIVDLFVARAASSRSSSRPSRSRMPPPGTASATPVSTRCRRPDSSFMQARSVASSSTLGRMRRPTATTVSAASTSASGSCAATASAFSRASRSAWSRGSSPVGTLSSISAGTPHRARRRCAQAGRACAGWRKRGRAASRVAGAP